jgi:hypothetical protein
MGQIRHNIQNKSVSVLCSLSLMTEHKLQAITGKVKENT